MAIRVDITARKKAEAQIYHAARHDALTGLLYRAALLEDLSERLGRAQQKLIIYLLDLDGFKCVNDTLGHAAGDALLKQLSSRLKSITSEGDLVARLGGDELRSCRSAPATSANKPENYRQPCSKASPNLFRSRARRFRSD
jgi:diguanylate cyclase (GGDEF)-like protein